MRFVLRETAQRVDAVARDDDIVVVCFEGGGDRGDDAVVVVDQKDAPALALGRLGTFAFGLRPRGDIYVPASRAGPAKSGIVKRKTLPPPGRSSIQIVPPCASTMPRQIARPRPTLCSSFLGTSPR